MDFSILKSKTVIIMSILITILISLNIYTYSKNVDIIQSKELVEGHLLSTTISNSKTIDSLSKENHGYQEQLKKVQSELDNFSKTEVFDTNGTLRYRYVNRVITKVDSFTQYIHDTTNKEVLVYKHDTVNISQLIHDTTYIKDTKIQKQPYHYYSAVLGAAVNQTKSGEYYTKVNVSIPVLNNFVINGYIKKELQSSITNNDKIGIEAGVKF